MTETTDRYSLNPLDNSAQMADELRRIWTAIRGLQGQPLTGVSAVSYDADGNPLVAVGNLPDGERGLEIHSATNNWDLVKMTTDGWFAPHLQGSPYDPNAVKNVVSGSFVQVWGITFGSILGPGLEVQVPWINEAGTTGEIQVTANTGFTSPVLALATGGSGYNYLRWLVNSAPGTGPLQVVVWARRSGGTGNVKIFQCQAWVQDPSVCTSAGAWV